VSKRVEFYFDVGSPYTYLAYCQLPRLTASRGARIVWRPMLLGGVFLATGNHSPVEVPAKGSHARVDLERWAEHFAVPFRLNPHFPINTLRLMRMAVALQESDDDALHRFLSVVFTALHVHGRDLSAAPELEDVLGSAGFDAHELVAWSERPETKDGLKQRTQEAVRRGVFGAPTFFVGNQMYWGQDRLLFVDQALA
jgi:2-hydroxychromene-2-carboxylate isomerase